MSWLSDLIKWNIATDTFNCDEPDSGYFKCGICEEEYEISDETCFDVDADFYICKECYEEILGD